MKTRSFLRRRPDRATPRRTHAALALAVLSLLMPAFELIAQRSRGGMRSAKSSMAPTPRVTTSKKCPTGDTRRRSSWYDGGRRNPRCTTMPPP